MLNYLRDDQRSLLSKVLIKRSPNLVGLIEELGAGRISQKHREDMRTAIGLEFAETGVDINSEPTKRGIQLEELLDAVNRPNIRKDRPND